jgi:hypothetical protein
LGLSGPEFAFREYATLEALEKITDGQGASCGLEMAAGRRPLFGFIMAAPHRCDPVRAKAVLHLRKQAGVHSNLCISSRNRCSCLVTPQDFNALIKLLCLSCLPGSLTSSMLRPGGALLFLALFQGDAVRLRG